MTTASRRALRSGSRTRARKCACPRRRAPSSPSPRRSRSATPRGGQVRPLSLPVEIKHTNLTAVAFIRDGSVRHSARGRARAHGRGLGDHAPVNRRSSGMQLLSPVDKKTSSKGDLIAKRPPKYTAFAGECVGSFASGRRAWLACLSIAASQPPVFLSFLSLTSLKISFQT